MAMDALKNLTNNVPDWLKRLDDLSGQIDQRQTELAAVAAAEGKNNNSETRSLRNKGSTESLKPKDDGPLHTTATVEPTPDDSIPEGNQLSESKEPREPCSPPPNAQKPPASPPSPTTRAHAALAAHSRARAQVKKRNRSSSVVSAEGAPPAYRTRSMIIVFYDSWVQGFFDDLVRFVSSSRNLMRKAKMAAKVAQIKRMAEMDVPDESNDGDENGGLPSLRYMSTRRLGPMSSMRGPPGSKDHPPDVYDNLDKGLDFVQSMCEHGAHQFLRDGDCNDEITKVQKRLGEVLEMARKEMERVQREEPELAKETGDMGKVRTRRPISMRREMSASLKDNGGTPTREEPPKLEAAKPEDARGEESKGSGTSNNLEVDDSLEADEGIDVDMDLPKLQYRSTRQMRNRGA